MSWTFNAKSYRGREFTCSVNLQIGSFYSGKGKYAFVDVRSNRCEFTTILTFTAHKDNVSKQ